VVISHSFEHVFSFHNPIIRNYLVTCQGFVGKISLKE
jgi:hypothetical protein